MKLNINENNLLFEMSNIRGKYVAVPHKLDFSFYFSPKDATESKDIHHGLRVKVSFNPEKLSIDTAGELRLHGDWKYTPSDTDKGVKAKRINAMKEFFSDYKTLFAAVLEKTPPDSLYDYFRGIIDFDMLLEEFEFYEEYMTEMQAITDLEELTLFIKKYNLFDLWDR